MTDNEKTQNESIARVAYLIAAADGQVNQKEREVLKKTLKGIRGYDFGTTDTTAFLEKLISDSDSLVRLRDFYDDDEIIEALMSKVTSDIRTIRVGKKTLRRAFAVWISICVADMTFSDFERAIIKRLQDECNKISSTVDDFLKVVVDFAHSSQEDPISSILSGTKHALSGTINVITDSYLEELESRCFTIDNLVAQYESSMDESERRSLLTSIEGLTESFEEFVNDDDCQN